MTLGLMVLVAVAASPAELNERFSRAVRLFNEGRIADATLEFQALESLQPNPVVEFNLAHCEARLGHPVQALGWIDPIVADDTKLPPSRLESGRALQKEQRALVATLELRGPAGVEGVLEIDGVTTRATLPLTRVINPGAHNLGFQSSGDCAARQGVTAAPGATVELTLDLVKAERPPARLRIVSEVSDVEVRIDGNVIATTPIASAIAVPPGMHALEARRVGYRPVQVPLSMSEGSDEKVALELVPDGTNAATLTVKPTEANAVVMVDGKRVTADVGTQVPVGPHAVRVEREGFFPMQQDVDVRGDTAVPAVLEPTSATLIELDRSRWLHRFWGALGIGVGAATAIAGSIVWGVYEPEIQKTQALYDTYKLCNPGRMACDFTADDVDKTGEYLYQLQLNRFGGILMMGGGVLLAGAGVISLLTAPDLSRYENRSTTGPLAPLSLSVSVGPSGAWVTGRF